jgi:hypothetical protein
MRWRRNVQDEPKHDMISAPGGSRTPNLLIRSYPALDAVLDQGIRTVGPSEAGGVIRSGVLQYASIR